MGQGADLQSKAISRSLSAGVAMQTSTLPAVCPRLIWHFHQNFLACRSRVNHVISSMLQLIITGLLSSVNKHPLLTSNQPWELFTAVPTGLRDCRARRLSMDCSRGAQLPPWQPIRPTHRNSTWHIPRAARITVRPGISWW